MTAPLNTVTWWELPTADMEAAKSFYGKVFGWTFVAFVDETSYAGIMNGDDLIGGLFPSEQPSTGSSVIKIYINVPDLEATLDKVTAAGGKVATPRTEVGGDMGWWAEITTPTGEWLGLCTDSPAA